MTEEYHVYGPPGTGKTRRAAMDIEKACDKYGNDKILVSSFTRAAATEIASRDIDVAKHHVGTLHSLCYRMLDRPELAELNMTEFNEAFPAYEITDGKAHLDEPGEFQGRTTGDRLLAQYQLLRARMIGRPLWPIPVLAFAKAWQDWKYENNYLDFTDLIEMCANMYLEIPTRPRCGFIDEAQDLSALEWRLVRTWAAEMDYLIVYGDDDQAIHDWCGGDAANLIAHDLPMEHKRFLTQSYRLPFSVWQKADTWIRRLSDRQEKAFKPDSRAGLVTSLMGTFRLADPVLDDIEREIEQDKTIMILASCSYMLEAFVRGLRDRYIAFHNPYRKTRGDWNPISTAAGSTANRVKAYLTGGRDFSPVWTVGQLRQWTDLINAKGILKHGAKKQIAEMFEKQPRDVLEGNELMALFIEDPWGMDPVSLDWLLKHAKAGKRTSIEYVSGIIKHGDLDNLTKPRVTVGTIHSVKGGEADIVYLAPDISREAYVHWSAGGRGRDSVIRTFYVGMTRARETLKVLRQASPLAVPL